MSILIQHVESNPEFPDLKGTALLYDDKVFDAKAQIAGIGVKGEYVTHVITTKKPNFSQNKLETAEGDLYVVPLNEMNLGTGPVVASALATTMRCDALAPENRMPVTTDSAGHENRIFETLRNKLPKTIPAALDEYAKSHSSKIAARNGSTQPSIT